jgi:transposase-like protein
MNQEVKDALRFHRKALIVKHILIFGKVKQQCREFEVPSSTYYEWKKKYDKYGREGLIRKKPIPLSHLKQLKQDVIDKIIELRKTFYLGPQRIAWYLERYHGVTTSCSTCCS